MARMRRPPVSPSRGRGGKQRVANNYSSPASGLKRPTRSKKGLNTSSPVASRSTLATKIAYKAIATPLVDSDDSDLLVTKKANQTLPNRKGYKRTEIYASGAVADGDTVGAHPSRKRKRQDDPEAISSKRLHMVGSPVTSQATPSSARSSLPQPGSQKPTTSKSLIAPICSPAMPASRSSSAIPNRIQGTPGAENSILGTLKPRKRQPSILQLIDGNNDSSSLNKEDEDDFLPDDQSTPLHNSKITAATSTPGSGLLENSAKDKHVSNSSGLRRPNTKRESSLLMIEVAEGLQPAEPELPAQPRRISPPKRSLKSPDADSVMASPKSSSPVKSPAKLEAAIISKSKIEHKKKKQPKPATTESLQVLMPSKTRRKKRRLTQPMSEFDIPEDFSSSQNQLKGVLEDEDESSFLPQKKGGKGRKKQPTTKAKGRKDRAASTVSVASKRTKGVSSARIMPPAKQSKNVIGAIKGRKALDSGGARHSDTTESEDDGDGDKENKGSFSRDLPRKVTDKWAEIDDWEMEFEEVDLASSSPGKR